MLTRPGQPDAVLAIGGDVQGEGGTALIGSEQKRARPDAGAHTADVWTLRVTDPFKHPRDPGFEHGRDAVSRRPLGADNRGCATSQQANDEEASATMEFVHSGMRDIGYACST
jgi:hypothetical protein